jgi:predicted HTH transcriptional regulator
LREVDLAEAEGEREMKTREEVEKLKRDWFRDAIWDIEDTEGFEEYRDELKEYSEKCQKAWDEAYDKRIAEEKAEAEKLGLYGLYLEIKKLKEDNAVLEQAIHYLVNGETNSAYQTLNRNPEYM